MLLESDGPARTPSRTETPSERALLRTVFHGYLQSQECLDDPEHVPLRDLGKRAPDVSRTTFVVDGSFTRAGAQQTLIGLFMGHCGLVGIHAENWRLSVIVVLEAGRILAITKAGPTNAIETIPIDIEKDGIDEIVAVTADYASGTTFSQAEIWSLADGPRSLAHFDLSLQSCRVGDGTYFESTLVSRWDPAAKRTCFLQRRRDVVCPP